MSSSRSSLTQFSNGFQNIRFPLPDLGFGRASGPRLGLARPSLWDAFASGRIARGERWAFTDLENEILIATANGNSLLERYALDPATDLGVVGLAEEWDYVASFYVVNDAMPPEVWTGLESNIAALLDTKPGAVLGGVSTAPVPGLAVKLLARTAPDLLAMMDALWAAAREAVLKLPPVSLRKY